MRIAIGSENPKAGSKGALLANVLYCYSRGVEVFGKNVKSCENFLKKLL